MCAYPQTGTWRKEEEALQQARKHGFSTIDGFWHPHIIYSKIYTQCETKQIPLRLKLGGKKVAMLSKWNRMKSWASVFHRRHAYFCLFRWIHLVGFSIWLCTGYTLWMWCLLQNTPILLELRTQMVPVKFQFCPICLKWLPLLNRLCFLIQLEVWSGQHTRQSRSHTVTTKPRCCNVCECGLVFSCGNKLGRPWEAHCVTEALSTFAGVGYISALKALSLMSWFSQTPDVWLTHLTATYSDFWIFHQWPGCWCYSSVWGIPKNNVEYLLSQPFQIISDELQESGVFLFLIHCLYCTRLHF